MFQAKAKKRSATVREMKILEEMENDVEKCFNNEGNSYNAQQVTGMRELLRGLVAKELASLPHETTDGR